LDPNPITDFGFPLLVVGIKLFVAGDDLLESRMRKPALDPHNNSLGHLV